MENLTEQQKLESRKLHPVSPFIYRLLGKVVVNGVLAKKYNAHFTYCLLYTSDAADEL